ncbi:hypothetical protein [Methylibium sp. Root1272]|uniref:hypothetical protein n=1 Tax=Methylibium sp. Root1272 TaxID=1736441 RepID=UPI000700A5CD|nr:hypothetical protein [Methylibium sp. Root1272]KQW70105.1 hypothetical protein ASC67_06405 [Methylibium sp. Root1272]
MEPVYAAESAIDKIAVEFRAWGRKRPRTLNAREALAVLQFEATFIAVAACNLANGKPLTAEDRQRLLVAAQRFDVLADEAIG